MAVRLAHAGHAVSAIARGPHLGRHPANGMKLVEGDRELVASDLTATDRVGEPGPQDVVLLALKAHQIVPVVDELPALLGPDTVIVTLQNGIPWWYFQQVDGDYTGRVVETVDPGGVLFKAIDPKRVVGCIAYPAAEIAEPGVIRHIEGNRFPVGELDGRDSDRVRMVSGLFEEAAQVPSPRRHPVRDLAQALGQPHLQPHQRPDPLDPRRHLPVPADPRPRRHHDDRGAAGGGAAGRALPGADGAPHRRGRERRPSTRRRCCRTWRPASLEVDGMLGVVVELAEMTGVEVPTLRALYACVSLLNRTIQEQGVRIKGAPK